MSRAELPEYIIRNGSYFREMKINCPTITLIQDWLVGRKFRQQIEVCNSSAHVVFNSQYVAEKYTSELSVPYSIIPLGVDFDFFTPQSGERGNQILFVGSSNKIKGFSLVLDLIENTSYEFCLIMKDEFSMSHPRVQVLNKLDATAVRDKMQQCAFLICTSQIETQHLAGIEAAACGLPVLATNVGVYYALSNGLWGRRISKDIQQDIKYMISHLNEFTPRSFFQKYNKNECAAKWKKLVRKVKDERRI